MAPNNRADVATAVDDDDLDGRGDAPEVTNGAPLPEAAAVEEAPADAPDAPDSTNGVGRDESRPARTPRPGRKRTSRQRALLVASAAAGAEETATTDSGASTADVDEPDDGKDDPSPVDPLLAGPPVQSDRERDDRTSEAP